MKIALDDGVRLHVMDLGAADSGTVPAFLVHGFTGSVEAWGQDLLRDLADSGRRVVAVDLPGHGRSDTPSDPRRYEMARVVGDLADLLDRLDISRADWVGYSMGGRIALGAAVLRADRVGRLVLEGGSPGIEEEEEAEARRRADRDLADFILAEGLESFVDAWMDLPLFRTQRNLPRERVDRERRRRMRCDPEGLAHTLRGLGTGRQPSFWEALEGLAIPTLLLTGRDDEKFTRMAREMSRRIPDATHVPVPGSGHAVHLERPEAWLREVTAFLDAGDEPGAGRTSSTGADRSTEAAPPKDEDRPSEGTPSTREGGRRR